MLRQDPLQFCVPRRVNLLFLSMKLIDCSGLTVDLTRPIPSCERKLVVSSWQALHVVSSQATSEHTWPGWSPPEQDSRCPKPIAEREKCSTKRGKSLDGRERRASSLAS